MGFMPGTITNSNEIMVLLGDNYFVKRTASQSREIIARRVQYLDSKIAALDQELMQLRAKAKVRNELYEEAQKMQADGVVDIQEPYVSDDEADETPEPMDVSTEGVRRVFTDEERLAQADVLR
eukprot:TRINITY_DN16683_c0_g1_i1.p1 TRINITY_DN16683_c0_g1~~TRINITY_DN16683_c0_g1_i1.p1  ORF type:complete len:123 (+),score=31.66 TRINITY_DN16683_c0_g1_i1:3-371(+)